MHKIPCAIAASACFARPMPVESEGYIFTSGGAAIGRQPPPQPIGVVTTAFGFQVFEPPVVVPKAPPFLH